MGEAPCPTPGVADQAGRGSLKTWASPRGQQHIYTAQVCPVEPGEVWPCRPQGLNLAGSPSWGLPEIVACRGLVWAQGTATGQPQGFQGEDTAEH